MTTNTPSTSWFLEVMAAAGEVGPRVEELRRASLEKLRAQYNVALEAIGRQPLPPVRYPSIVPAIDDKDGGHLPMTGKTAVRRRQEVLAAERRSVMRAQDAALHRALEWTR